MEIAPHRNYWNNVSIWIDIFLVTETITSMIDDCIHFGCICLRKMFLWITETFYCHVIYSDMNCEPLNQ